MNVISITLVSPGVLESRDADRKEPIAPSSMAPVELNEGAASPDQRDTKPEEPDKPEKKSEEQPRTADAILEINPKPQKRPVQQQSPQGGASSSGDAKTETKASAAVAASAGASREYARSVAQALRKTKPKGMGARGSVKVKFVIGERGQLTSLEVSKSSGSPSLDQKALHAVEATIFPAPPVGMTNIQLTYEVPYNFR